MTTLPSSISQLVAIWPNFPWKRTSLRSRPGPSRNWVTRAASLSMENRGHGSLGPRSNKSAHPERPRNSSGASDNQIRGIREIKSGTNLLERAVRSVTGRYVCRMFASTKIDRRGRIGFVLDRSELGILVRSVAEGLRLALSARTPPIALTFCNLDTIGCFLSNVWRCHSPRPPLTRCRRKGLSARPRHDTTADCFRRNDATVAEGHTPDKKWAGETRNGNKLCPSLL